MTIEQLHPGVYLSELPFSAHPIDGVDTSGAGVQAPQWTQGQAHDPGLAPAQLMPFLSDALSYRADGATWHHAAAAGVTHGLAVRADATAPDALHVSPGLAVRPDGHLIDSEPRTDLAALVSRYIGETEKNIAAAFADAPSSCAVLCFEESASLFDDDRP
jgi:hypothetical protein